MKHFEKKEHSHSVFKGKILHLHVDDVSLEDGSCTKREIVSHPGAVGILAFTESEEILLVKQFRYALQEVVLEIPAGRMDKHETHLDCAKRELLEETGYVSDSITYLGQVFPSPGYSNEVIHLYVAKNCTYQKQQLEAGEFLDVELYTLTELNQMILDNKIWDAKTLVALLKYSCINPF